MGYVASEIIILLAVAALVGVFIGAAIFGFRKRGTHAQAEHTLAAERLASAEAEARHVAREANLSTLLDERDAKLNATIRERDEAVKRRNELAADAETQQRTIAALEFRLREAPPADATTVTPLNPRVQELERENAELRAALTMSHTRGAGVAIASSDSAQNTQELATLRQERASIHAALQARDAAVADLQRELATLRATSREATLALEEQDAALNKLTRDLQSAERRLSEPPATSPSIADATPTLREARPSFATSPAADLSVVLPGAEVAADGLSLDALLAEVDAHTAASLEESPLDGERTVAGSIADFVASADSAALSEGDDLTRIRGLSPAGERRLKSQGFTTWAQLAALQEADLQRVAALLEVTVDRIRREQWVEQARALAT